MNLTKNHHHPNASYPVYSCWNHEKGVCLPGDSFGCTPETGRAQVSVYYITIDICSLKYRKQTALNLVMLLVNTLIEPREDRSAR